MSATRYKKPHVDILICIEMTRERNLGIKKKHPVYCIIGARVARKGDFLKSFIRGLINMGLVFIDSSSSYRTSSSWAFALRLNDM